jgi:hypothetical protein
MTHERQLSARAALLAKPAAPDWRRYARCLAPLLAALAVLAARGQWQPPAYFYVWAAEQVRLDRIGPALYDDAATLAAIERDSQGQARDIFTPSPPSVGLLFVPLLYLSPAALTAAWSLGQASALLLTLSLLLSRLGRLARLPLLSSLLVLAVTLSEPMGSNWRGGQVYLWLTAWYAAVFWATTGRHLPARGWRATGAGLALALAFVLKVAGWPLWAWLIARREWPLALRAGAFIGLGLTASLPVVGLDTWWYYWTVVVPTRAGGAIAALTAFQTLNGFLQHMLRYDSTYNPAPLIDLPGLAAVLGVLATAGLLGVTLWRARALPRTLSAGAAVALIPVLSPIAEQYHYLVLLIALAAAVAAWSRRRAAGAGLVLLGATALLFLPLPFRDPRLAQSALALLAYPRLYGALLVWGFLVAGGGLPAAARLGRPGGQRAAAA